MAIKDPFKKWVHYRWHAIRQRTVNSGSTRINSPYLRCYYKKGIRVEISKDQFFEWCYSQRELIDSMDRPSIDRINSNGHYELNNMRIIEFDENRRNGQKRSVEVRSTPVVCWNPKTGEKIRFCSQREVVLMGFKQGDVSRAIKRNNKHYGYYWKFEKDSVCL